MIEGRVEGVIEKGIEKGMKRAIDRVRVCVTGHRARVQRASTVRLRRDCGKTVRNSSMYQWPIRIGAACINQPIRIGAADPLATLAAPYLRSMLLCLRQEQ